MNPFLILTCDTTDYNYVIGISAVEKDKCLINLLKKTGDLFISYLLLYLKYKN